MARHDDHDDFGGLQRDLRATGAVMDRRHLFRIAATLGVGISALELIGCSGNTAVPDLCRRRDDDTDDGVRLRDASSRRDAGPVSGGRFERPERSWSERRCP